MKRKLLGGAAVAAAVLLIADPASAQSTADLGRGGDDLDLLNMIVLDNIFIFFCAVLVLFMQAGFAMVEAGFTEAKNAANIMMKNLMDVAADHVGKFLGSLSILPPVGLFHVPCHGL